MIFFSSKQIYNFEMKVSSESVVSDQRKMATKTAVISLGLLLS